MEKNNLFHRNFRGRNWTAVLSFFLLINFAASLFAEEAPYLEPGSIRLSHDLVLEGLFHRVRSGWNVQNIGVNKEYSQQNGKGGVWKSDWGESLLTEVAARFSPELFGRVLFEAQGDYADRFWRPNNIEHDIDQKNRHVFLREAEAKIDKGDWHAHAFNGTAHGNWREQGDFFELYPASYPNDDYLHNSGYFGIYPDEFNQNLFLNISKRRVPSGIEAGADVFGFDTGVAYGDELTWGYSESFYGRFGVPLRGSKLTFIYKDEDVPYSLDQNEDERNRAYALSWAYPADQGKWIEAGILYQPFRVGKRYKVADDVGAGSGLLGSSFEISEKTAQKEDGLAERLRVERHTWIKDRDYLWAVDLTHAGILAGNKDQVDVSLATDLISVLRGKIQYIYRRPIEGPIPFLYEGTPSNLGAIAANPRGPESPFIVDWSNREASFITTTFTLDPTPGTPLLLYNPDVLQMWNLNPQENARFTLAFQFRLVDYKTTTDRQYYYNEEGNIQFEPAAHTGAWATDQPLPEFRVFAHGRTPLLLWTFGFAGGESPAQSGLAYSQDTSVNKPITDYYSFEGRLEKWPWGVWGHYGWGVWGPEPYQYFFGESFDQLWGLGLSYNITVNTKADISYLSARQNDSLFVAPDLGSYDEIRMLFSHRFGFLLQFQEAARPGYQAR